MLFHFNGWTIIDVRLLTITDVLQVYPNFELSNGHIWKAKPYKITRSMDSVDRLKESNVFPPFLAKFRRIIVHSVFYCQNVERWSFE